MKLFSYWRSLATYRVRIALNLKGITPDEVITVNLHEGKQRDDAYPQDQSDDGDPGADRERRHRAVRVAGDPGISRRDASQSAAAAEGSEGARARARHRADHRLRHPSADRAARARISGPRIQDRRARRDEMGPPLAHDGAQGAGDQSRRLEGDRHASRKATSSPSPTSACADRRWARPISRSTWRRIRPSSASSTSATRSTRWRARIRSSSRARRSRHDQYRDRRPRLVGQEPGEGGARVRRAAALHARRHARARHGAATSPPSTKLRCRASTRCWRTATSRRSMLATPHTKHPRAGEGAAKAGKQIYCEKPFALSKADAQRHARRGQARRRADRGRPSFPADAVDARAGGAESARRLRHHHACRGQLQPRLAGRAIRPTAGACRRRKAAPAA